MICVNDLLHDSRFYIDEWNAKRILAIPITNYSVTKIKVGDILRELDGEIYRLKETDVYRFLEGGEDARSRYKNYCDKYCKGNENRGEEQFFNLIEQLRSEPYDIKKGAIVVNQYNMIQEGQHRACVLLYLYGDEFEIEVVKVNYSGFRIRAKIRYFLWKMKNVGHKSR